MNEIDYIVDAFYQQQKEKDIKSLVLAITDEAYNDKNSEEYLNILKIKGIIENKLNVEVVIKSNTQLNEMNQGKINLNSLKPLLENIKPRSINGLANLDEPFHLKVDKKKRYKLK
jgi:hypothetical protein